MKTTLALIFFFSIAFCCLFGQTNATSSFDVNTILMPTSKFLFGITMDSRTGMQGSNNSGSIGYFNTDGTLISEVAPLFSDFPVPSLRYPANGILMGFDWKKSIGNPASRPNQNLLGSQGQAQPVLFGFDEFMDWTASKGVSPADVHIMVSIYDSATIWPDPIQQSQALPNIIQHCADWVEYCNAPNDGSNPGGGTDWAAIRSANGHDAPYGIKLWNMGNEPWASHEFGASTSGCNTYLNLVEPIIDAMRAIDPSIHIVLATVGTNLGPNTWHSVILNSSLVAAGKVYGLSPHAFPVESGSNTKVSNFVSIYSDLADSCQVHGLKMILGDYAHGIPQMPPTQAEQDIAMQWQGAILSADFLMGMSKISNLERVNFWTYGMPRAQWHPIRKLNGIYTLMPTAQMYKKLQPFTLDHAISTTNTCQAGSDGNPYAANTSAFASSDLTLVNIISVNRDIIDTIELNMMSNASYSLDSARLLTASGPTAESYSETFVNVNSNGNFIIPPMSILILEYELLTNEMQEKNSSSLKLFPNPANSELFFSNELNDIKILNQLGQIVYHSSITAASINIEFLSDGMYILQSEVVNSKFFIKR